MCIGSTYDRKVVLTPNRYRACFSVIPTDPSIILSKSISGKVFLNNAGPSFPKLNPTPA